MRTTPPDLPDLISQLTLEEKVLLLSGQDAWSTYALAKIGLRKMVLSDGPTGVRGPLWDERDPSLSLPSATCVAATWDRTALHSIGKISASEARRKGVDVVLGPTINLHRSPRGGRHFECYSEDPFLTGELAVAYIRGVQEQGVAATPKHYVGNDSENERFTYEAIIDEQTLHELYLAPFEAAVREANAWVIMAAYNGVNGPTLTENELLREPLKGSWGFDGVVVSDWTAVRTIKASANAGTDLAMPGPITPWSKGLVDAVRAGKVAESIIDDKVERLLRLAQRVGALDSHMQRTEPLTDARGEIRRIASQGMVLVENNGVLPLNSKAKKIAVIGAHAYEGRIMGGGSATVIPFMTSSPVDGIRSSAPEGTVVTHAFGTHVVEDLEQLPIQQCQTTKGEQGIELSLIDENRTVLRKEIRQGSFFVYLSDSVAQKAVSLTARTRFTAKVDGLHRFGGAGIGEFNLRINDSITLEANVDLTTTDLAVALLAPPQRYIEVELKALEQIDIELEFTSGFDDLFGFTCLFGFRAPRLPEEVEWQHAIDMASVADIAIVVVGTTALVESEGFDRKSITLPGRQDELVRAIGAVNKNTIVIVNAGGPVELPWRNEVSAVLLTWFPGEEFGNALADVLFGHAEPGGRMPTTWASTLEEAPVTDTDPLDSKLVYNEGINIGYRAWATSANSPAYHFGYGLGYTAWEIVDFTVPSELSIGQSTHVRVSMKNTGTRVGSEIVQIYLSRQETSVTRPPLWLAGFERITAEPGETVSVDITISALRFQHWNGGWQTEPGAFTLVTASDASLKKARSASIRLIE